MKCGIITFTYGDNYGQRLQNLAMQELMKEYFKEVYTIRQIDINKSVSERVKDYIIPSKKLRKKSFKKFDKKYISYYPIPISEKTSKDFPESKFDYFVVGSDQVWSPFSPDVNSTMFLTFTKIEKRIAISPSLSCEKIPQEKYDEFSTYLKGFQYISTREEQGSELVSNIIGRNVITLLDPTLMFEQDFWEKYVHPIVANIPENYCLCYCLGNEEDLQDIKLLCNSLNLNLVNLMTSKKYYSLGPGEFLYLIKNAKLVITDSYHGTIFSYIFKVPFLNFTRKGTDINMNSRFDTLFRKMGISKRNIFDIKKDEIFNIDFGLIEANIKLEKKKMHNYISKIICHKNEESW